MKNYTVNGRVYTVKKENGGFKVSSDKMVCHDNGKAWDIWLEDMKTVFEFMDVNSGNA